MAVAGSAVPVPFSCEGGAKRNPHDERRRGGPLPRAALALSASRAVLIAVVPAVGILLLWRFGWRRGGVFLLAGGIPALALLGYQAAARFTSPDPYNYARLVMWKSAVRIFQSYPFGVGLGGYKYYWFATQSPVEGAFAKYGKYATTAHNEFLEVLTGLGAVGLVLFLLVLLVPVFLAVRGFRGIEEGRKWAAAGAAGGLLVSGIHAMFDFNFHEIGLVVLDAILLGALLAWLPPGRFTLPVLRLSVGEATRCGGGDPAARRLDGDRGGKNRSPDGSLASPARRHPRSGEDVPYGHGCGSVLRHVSGCDGGARSPAVPCGSPGREPGSSAGRIPADRIHPLGGEGRLPEPEGFPEDIPSFPTLSSIGIGVSRKQEDLGASIDWAGRALEINPYSAEKFWDGLNS